MINASILMKNGEWVEFHCQNIKTSRDNLSGKLVGFEWTKMDTDDDTIHLLYLDVTEVVAITFSEENLTIPIEIGEVDL
jgi:hypothetical protein